MKWILFFLIPILGYSQVKSLDDILNIDSIGSFKRVMIENSYEGGDDGNERYFYAVRDGLEGDGWIFSSDIYAEYERRFMLGDDIFKFIYKNMDLQRKNGTSYYDLIYDEVKKECTFFGIISIGYPEYALYTCPNSKFKGKIGFSLIDNIGTISIITQERLNNSFYIE